MESISTIHIDGVPTDMDYTSIVSRLEDFALCMTVVNCPGSRRDRIHGQDYPRFCFPRGLLHPRWSTWLSPSCGLCHISPERRQNRSAEAFFHYTLVPPVFFQALRSQRWRMMYSGHAHGPEIGLQGSVYFEKSCKQPCISRSNEGFASLVLSSPRQL